MTNARITVTAALPYANGPLHIGHIAGAYLPADIFVRYQRQQKRDIIFMSGSDEHGAAIMLRAKKEGISPREIIDKYHEQNKETFERFGISFDMYHRTSEPIHHQTSQEFFTTLYEKGEFTEQESEQYYDEEYQQFLADRYITGTCPVCGHPEAYGDQCENCGSSLSPTDLINPKSTLSGKTPVLKPTKHWYLPLDKYQPWLEEWLLKGKQGKWKPNVYGQCSSWLKAGLQPRAMTRDLDWGVDVPLPNTEGKKLYVWLDAPIGYISATKQWAQDNEKDWELYWKQQADEADNARLIHFIGKDNIVFHCIIFPAILHTHGEYILPENVPANEFLNLEGRKLSTSRNWAVWLHEYLDELPDKQDELRYTLCSIMPENKDSEFTWKDYQAKNNNELVAILGNFVNRTLVLTQKYFNGVVPPCHELQSIDEEVLHKLEDIPQKLATAIESFNFREAQNYMMELARTGNKYLADTEPWKAIKEDEKRVATILNISLQITASLSVVCQPFLPFTAQRLQQMLNFQSVNWNEAGKNNLLATEHTLEKPALLFQKVEDEWVEQQVAKLHQDDELTIDDLEPIAKFAPMKEEITYDDFVKLDMRVATILTAEKVKKSKKLLKMTLDTGLDQRTVLSGIAQHYEPEAIIGKQVCVLVNLAPRKMMGIESQGMILMAEDTDGKLLFIQPEGKIDDGSGIS
ncbi:methionine--tRNA ligase [Tunicatimonas pelagia]|uniref:methionine--tRNA ligase n=1 Tax=Tunicatimonas pelagia TaxID=931531 RepID=UPI002666AC0E|nr:methionine--tRNA ligase [Tunicatimonas pelagia]WKN40480.1 methionine--tRNA ligase [Tunicatimonas pelagia]